MSDLRKSLQTLLMKDSDVMIPDHTQAFEQLKRATENDCTLSFYEDMKPLFTETDAIRTGVVHCVKKCSHFTTSCSTTTITDQSLLHQFSKILCPSHLGWDECFETIPIQIQCTVQAQKTCEYRGSPLTLTKPGRVTLKLAV